MLSTIIVARFRGKVMSFNVSIDRMNIRTHYVKSEDLKLEDKMKFKVLKELNDMKTENFLKFMALSRDTNIEEGKDIIILDINEKSSKVIKRAKTSDLELYVIEPLYYYGREAGRYAYIFSQHVDSNTNILLSTYVLDIKEKQCVAIDVHGANITEANPTFRRRIASSLDRFDKRDELYNELKSLVDIFSKRGNIDSSIFYMVEDHREPVMERQFKSGIIPFNGLLPTQISNEIIHSILFSDVDIPFEFSNVEKAN